MRIADNSLKAMLDFYHRELDPIYGAGESRALFDLAVEHYLKIERAEIPGQLSRRLQQSEILQIYDCGKALKANVPIQYHLGEARFMGLDFKINSRVLIPRPETEELCDLIVRENSNAKHILDIGTGSGCIPVSLKHALPQAEVFACDVCAEALEVAMENAIRNQTDVHFIKADVLDVSFPSRFTEAFDVIVSNPPYVLRSETGAMEKTVLDHEPGLALFVEGNDPILFYRYIIGHCSNLLNPDGKLYFELNPLTADAVANCARETGMFSEVELFKDISGKWRFLKATSKNEKKQVK